MTALGRLRPCAALVALMCVTVGAGADNHERQGGALGALNGGQNGPQPARPGDDVGVSVDGAEESFRVAGEAPGAPDLMVEIAAASPYLALNETHQIPVRISRLPGGPRTTDAVTLVLEFTLSHPDLALELDLPDIDPEAEPGINHCTNPDSDRLGVVECDIDPMLAGEEVYAVLRLTAHGSPGRGETVSLTARISGGSDSVPSNNVAATEFRVFRTIPVDPDAEVNLAVAIDYDIDPQIEGLSFLPRVVVTNRHPDAVASNVQLQMRYELVGNGPDGAIRASDATLTVDMDAMTASLNECEAQPAGYVCRIDQLGPGDSQALLLRVDVDAMPGRYAQFRMRARVRAVETDTDLGDNATQNAVAVVTRRPELRLLTRQHGQVSVVDPSQPLASGFPLRVDARFADILAAPVNAPILVVAVGEREWRIPTVPRVRGAATEFRSHIWAVLAPDAEMGDIPEGTVVVRASPGDELSIGLQVSGEIFPYRPVRIAQND